MLKTNAKSVRQAVKDHIIEKYENDFECFKHDYNAVGSILNLIEAGSFMFYYSDVRQFLKTIFEETEEEANKYSDDQVWLLYTYLVSSEGDKFINKNSF